MVHADYPDNPIVHYLKRAAARGFDPVQIKVPQLGTDGTYICVVANGLGAKETFSFSSGSAKALDLWEQAIAWLEVRNNPPTDYLPILKLKGLR
jgi:hypothetical protein